MIVPFFFGSPLGVSNQLFTPASSLAQS